MKYDRGISISKGLPSVLVDRLFDLYLLVVLSLIGIWKFDIFAELSLYFLVLIVITILSPIIILHRMFMASFASILYKFAAIKKNKDRIEGHFSDFYNELQKLIDFRLFFSGSLTCVSYLIFFIQCYLLTIAMGLSISFVTISLFMAISNLISFIPISISGLGTRDAVLIFLFFLIGLKPELAVTYAFLVFVNFFIVVGLLGFIAWCVKPILLNIPSQYING